MSMELLVIFALSKTPSFEAWEAELAASKAPVRFIDNVDLQKHSGFLPMQVQGRESGLFFLQENYAELASNYKALSDLSVKDPSVYSLGYGGHFDECAAAFYSAAALVRITGGSAFEPQGDEWLTVYNHERPHESLGRVPPLMFMPRLTSGVSSYRVST